LVFWVYYFVINLQPSFIGKPHISDHELLLAAILELQIHGRTNLPPTPRLTYQKIVVCPNMHLEGTKGRHEDRKACQSGVIRHRTGLRDFILFLPEKL
jgi:hypothetical protein